MNAEQSFLMEIMSKLDEIQLNTVDLDTKNELGELIDLIENAID